MAKGKKSRIWTFFDNLEGDKVVWMIVFLLFLFSAVSIFSSTSMMVNENQSRVDIIKDQLQVMILGLLLIVGCFLIKNIKVYRILARFGFLASIAMLLIVDLRIGAGSGIGAGSINGAWRVIRIGGFQLHVYEVVKVAMVMYLAWAMDAMGKKELKLLNCIGKKFPALATPVAQRIICLYLPILIIMMAIAPGSGSSCVFIGAIMVITIMIGGVKLGKLIIPVLILGLIGGGVILVDKATDGKLLSGIPRLETWKSRLQGSDAHIERFLAAKYKSAEYYEELDKIRQPYSANIAIHEGGLIGKGPGQSTQRYVVPVMYEDYMFSFILEEYGLLGGIVLIILYMSLLSRGSIIARNCCGDFAKITIAGLVILISGQAFMHMFINAGIGPLTGQTLPLISHGKTSFLVFCIAFGIILSISRMASKRIERETRNAEPLIEPHQDPVRNDLDELDRMEDALLDE